MLKRLSFLWFLSLLTGITLWAAPPEGGYLKVSELYDGIKVTVGNAYVPNGYMNAVFALSNGEVDRHAEIAKQTSSIALSSSARFDVYPATYGGGQSIWVLEAADVSDVTNDADKANVYYLHNVLTGTYMGKCPETDDNNVIVPLATTKAEAGRYQVVGQTLTIDSQNYGEQVYFRDIDATKSANCLSCGNSFYGTPPIRGHIPNDGDNWFFLRVAPDDVKTLTFPDLANKELYINSKTIFLKNSDGTYGNYHLAYNRGVANGSNFNRFDANDTISGGNAVWTFLPAGQENTYYLLNKADKVYVGKTNTAKAGVDVVYTTDKSQAGRYEIVDLGVSETAFGMRDYDNPVYGYLTLDPGWETKTYQHTDSETGETVTDQTYKRLVKCTLRNSALSLYSGDAKFLTEYIEDYKETKDAQSSARKGEVFKYPAVVDQSASVHTAFLVEEPHDVAINLVAPGVELSISPRAKFNDEGYLNVYDEMGIIVGEKAENAWMSVWNLKPDDKYDEGYEGYTGGYKDLASETGIQEYKEKKYRANDVHNNWNLRLGEIAAAWPNETDIHKLAYNLYNRSLKEYISVAGGKVSLVKKQAEAGEFYIVPSEDGNSVMFKTTDGQYCLSLDNSNNQLAVVEADAADNNSQFWLKGALDTSYSGIYDGAVVEFEPYRYDGSKLYLDKKAGVIYRSTINDNGETCDYDRKNPGFDPGAYKAWKLIQCYETSASSSDSSESAPQKALGVGETPIADTYYVYNELAKMYVKPIPDSDHKAIQLTTDLSQAGQYTFYADQEHSAGVVIKDCNTANGQKYWNVSATSTGGEYNLTTYELREDNRLFFVNALRETPESMMDYIYDGAYIQMIPWLYKGEQNEYWREEGGYVYQSTDDNNALTSDYKSEIKSEEKTSELNTIWRIHEIKDAKDADGNALNDVYYIVNEGTGEYLCKDDAGNVVTRKLGEGQTPKDIKAIQYQIIPDEVSGRFVVFKDIDSVDTTNKTCTYLSTDVAKSGDNDAVSTSETKGTGLQPSAVGKDNWYYITPVDMETEIEKDLLDWIVKNLNPDNESIVGFFDAKKDAYIATYDENGQPKRDAEGNIIKDDVILPVVSFKIERDGNPLEHKFDKDDNYLGEYSVTMTGISMPENPEIRQLTFVELLALVQYYYNKQQNNEEFSAQEKVYSTRAYEALINMIENEEFIVHPRMGRFYQIESAYTYYRGVSLRETYYAEHFMENKQTQRVGLHVTDWDTYEVPSFWRFDQVDKLNGTDAEHYFFVRAVNSRNVLSLTGDREVVDTRAENNPEAAVYSLAKPYNLIVYPGAVVLKSHYNNAGRTSDKGKSYLGMYKDPTDPLGLGIPREGSVDRIEATELQPTENAQNWFIKEVKEVPIDLWASAYDDDPAYTENNYYYNTFCFPFKVELPAFDDATYGGLKAYTNCKTDVANNGKVIELEELAANDEGKVIIPAFQPVIIESRNQLKEAKLKIVYAEGEEYGYDYDGYAPGNGRYTQDEIDSAKAADEKEPWSMTSITSLYPVLTTEKIMTNTQISQSRNPDTNIVGAVTPDAIDAGAKFYVVHNDCNDSAELVIGGETFSYDVDDVNTATMLQMPNMSLASDQTATYIVPSNTAILKAEPAEDDEQVAIIPEDEVTSGVENVSVEPTASDEAPIWYDLQGFRVVNPVAGNVYIRVTSTETTKVLYR